jgi:hypothetical protein
LAYGESSLFPFLFRGRVELAHVGGHARASAKAHKSVVYDSGGFSYLFRARGSCISCSGGGIRHGVCGVLSVGILHAMASIFVLLTTVL